MVESEYASNAGGKNPMNELPAARGGSLTHAVADSTAGPPVRLNLALVTPIFNDFASFIQLCREIDLLAGGWNVNLSVIAVDDGSLQSAEPVRFHPPLVNISQVRLVKLRSNLGHQRAIAIGLVEAAEQCQFDAILISDSDGEDRPVDMGRLIAQHRERPDAIVVARRSKRSEGLRFRAFYLIYKAVFHAFTGKKIDFGNFVLLPGAALARLVNMPETWNHLAACILRSRIPIASIGCHRGTRYAGTSSMSLVTLLIHGLSAVSVFNDFVFARMLVASAGITVLAIVMATAAVIIRLGSNLAVPGWATGVVGFSMIMLFQAILFSMVASLTMLRNRSALAFVPSAHAQIFVAERLTLFDACPVSQERNDHV
jgi:polyisoprenyl-phosphate glycosyltransferase